MVGFTASLVVGGAAGNPAATVVWRSLIAFLLCYLVGKIVGFVAQRTIEEDIAAYKREHPIPRDPATGPVVTADVNVDIVEEAEEVRKPVNTRSAA